MARDFIEIQEQAAVFDDFVVTTPDIGDASLHDAPPLL